jgi:hypothetical protein
LRVGAGPLTTCLDGATGGFMGNAGRGAKWLVQGNPGCAAVTLPPGWKISMGATIQVLLEHEVAIPGLVA